MRSLDKRAKEAVMNQMAELDEITTEAVMDLVRPHYIFDPFLSKEREIRVKANRLMAQFRDERGIRSCFNYKDAEGQSKYVNIDKTKNDEALKRVEAQIRAKFNGLNKAKRKITRRRLELAGQLGFDFDATA
jgi:hypothetical protein